ncbi:MAG: hypothetical protein Q9167_005099 [Letrouitia subvulpina]
MAPDQASDSLSSNLPVSPQLPGGERILFIDCHLDALNSARNPCAHPTSACGEKVEGLRTYVGCPSIIPALISHPSPTRSDSHSVVSPARQNDLPRSVKLALEYQRKAYRQLEPDHDASKRQRDAEKRGFDPEAGSIYTRCSECDTNGGLTFCQHPEDPKEYSLEVNPSHHDDPIFHSPVSRSSPLKRATPITPTKLPIRSNIISPASTSPVKVSGVTSSGSPFNKDCAVPGQNLTTAAATLQGLAETGTHRQDKMLVARQLSKFLSENVQEDVVSKYIIFTCHGTLLGYSDSITVKEARQLAAIGGLTWRTKESALPRDVGPGFITNVAPLFKKVNLKRSSQNGSLVNLVCESKQGQLISIQWIKNNFLIASILDAQATSDGDDEKGKGVAISEDKASNDNKSIEESTKEPAEEPEEPEEPDGKAAQEQPPEPSKPSPQQILIWKSEGMAEALRQQDLVMPRGFH